MATFLDVRGCASDPQTTHLFTLALGCGHVLITMLSAACVCLAREQITVTSAGQLPPPMLTLPPLQLPLCMHMIICTDVHGESGEHLP